MPGQSFRGFTERVALVTGGGQGIGRAAALQLALEGAYVIVNYAPEDTEGAHVAEELREMGTLAHAVEGDVSQIEDVRRIFAMVEDTYGRLDMLVNAASLTRESSFDALTEEDWDEAVKLPLKGAFLCSQAAARLMRKRPRPAIVNVASEGGVTGRTGSANMVAAHAGVIGLTKALARELAPRIRVNCVAVSGAENEKGTGLHMRSESQENKNAGTDALAVRLPAPADEVARACVYLLSSDAAFITGQTLVISERSP